MTSRSSSSLGWVVVLTLLWVDSARSDVCVWRNPEQTMSRLFPEARDYVTITKKMTPQVVARIEQQLGIRLDDSEQHEFNFYDLRTLKDGKPTSVGTAMALAGKGEYGAIEVVIGVNPRGLIRNVYIQRSREKAAQALKSRVFLDQFIGKSAESPLEFGKDLKRLEVAPIAAEAVLLTIKKMLLFYKELNVTGPRPENGRRGYQSDGVHIARILSFRGRSKGRDHDENSVNACLPQPGADRRVRQAGSTRPRDPVDGSSRQAQGYPEQSPRLPES